jgi:aldose sugar dehydrogenase
MLAPMFSRMTAALLFVCFTAAACGKNNPDVPPTLVPTGERITGNERFGWDQVAGDAVELAAFRYVMYVDGARSELANVRCDGSPSAAGFPCSAQLPPLTAGAHTLELASFVVDGATVLESAKSASLRVVVGPQLVLAPLVDTAVITADGITLKLEPIVDALDDPTDVVFSPDGRAFVAEANATVRVVRLAAAGSGSSVSVAGTGDDRLLALALDPAFSQTHHVFALLTTRGDAGGRTFLLARFREAEGSLLDRVVILEQVPTAVEPHGALRFGPDGKLYAALDDGGVARLAGDLASRNGKLLRMNPDGSTPDDQANLSPIFSYGFRAPHALDWQPSSGTAWLADESASHEPLLYALEKQAPRTRSRVLAAFRLPAGTTITAAMFYRGRTIPAFEQNLFVASDSGDSLLRFVFAPGDSRKIVSTEPLLRAEVGPLRVVAQGPDGSIYVATRTALARLTSAAR